QDSGVARRSVVGPLARPDCGRTGPPLYKLRAKTGEGEKGVSAQRLRWKTWGRRGRLSNRLLPRPLAFCKTIVRCKKTGQAPCLYSGGPNWEVRGDVVRVEGGTGERADAVRGLAGGPAAGGAQRFVMEIGPEHRLGVGEQPGRHRRLLPAHHLGVEP